MFRKIRRIKNEISGEQCIELLKNEKRATLAMMGCEGYPYAIPIDFYYDEGDGCIYFHCAKQGHKIDAIKANDKVCFTVWGDEEQVPGDWSYKVSSVVCFGRAAIIEDEETKLAKAKAFGCKYYPTPEEVDIEIEKDGRAANMVRITIDHMSGKRVHEK